MTAQMTNLWQARQILLHSGNACEVLEPPERVEMFLVTAQRMADIYLDEKT